VCGGRKNCLERGTPGEAGSDPSGVTQFGGSGDSGRVEGMEEW